MVEALPRKGVDELWQGPHCSHDAEDCKEDVPASQGASQLECLPSGGVLSNIGYRDKHLHLLVMRD